VREFGVFDPTPFEAGVTCALRSRVPVVVEDPAMSPYHEYTVDAGGDLVGTAERVGSESLDGHIEVLRSFFSATPVIDVDVRRRDGDLKVTLTLAKNTPEWTMQYVISRAAGVLREYDRYAPRIDVAVRRAS
jgi:hypothetical protein